MSIEVESLPMEAIDRDYGQSYRALSSSAVASCVLGALSVSTLLSYEYGLVLGAIPILALLLGVYALWTISRNPMELTGKWLAQLGVMSGAFFLVTGWALAGYVYATEVPPGYERLTYSDLQPDPDQPRQIVPEGIEKWDGKRVFIKGYVYPGAQQENIKKFVLCRDNGDCCFGGSPKLTDMVLVELADPLRLTYSKRVQRLAGTFRVKQGQATDGLGGVLYQLEADYLE